MKEYTVEIGGLEHTLLLSDEDADRMGVKSAAKQDKAAVPPKNKSGDR